MTSRRTPGRKRTPQWQLRAGRLLRRIAIRTALLVVGLAAGLLLSELSLRAYYWHPTGTRFYRDLDEPPWYGLQPDVAYEYEAQRGVVTVTTTAEGHRSTPGAPSQADAVLHVVGDSQVFGWDLDDGETITAQLQQRLGSSWRVVNHGVPGYGPHEYAAVLRTIPLHEPTIVLLTEANDLRGAVAPKTKHETSCGFLMNRGGSADGLPCFVLSSRLFSVVVTAMIRSSSPRLPVPLLYHPRSHAGAEVLRYRALATLAPEAEARGIHFTLGWIPWDAAIDPSRLRGYEPPLTEATRQIALDDPLGLFEVFVGAEQPGTLFLPGDHHLSPRGAELVASVLAERAPGLLGEGGAAVDRHDD